MPKITAPEIPLNGLFAINKPSGMISMQLLDKLKRLIVDSPLFIDKHVVAYQREWRAKTGKSLSKYKKKNDGGPKVGQGGTLDPLAKGVLVIGVGRGTKKLSQFLHCTKEYRAIGLLGCETDSYDSEGALVRTASWEHVTRQKVEDVLQSFRGKIKQYPPIYSAIKMNGKPLYEYAREGVPLPRPIEAREAEVTSLELIGWQEADGHHYTFPAKVLDDSQKQDMTKLKKLILEAESNRESSGPEEEPVSLKALETTETATPPSPSDKQSTGPPVFELKMTVSSGTYVRSIIHDIGLALKSAAHVVLLERTRQGDFVLDEGEGKSCVDWSLFQAALDRQDQGLHGSPVTAIENEDDRAEWEKQVLANFEHVEPRQSGSQ
ncbi:hypothetical protein FRC03_007724 [Tulasnella sp. 419]|nr:hypothetical protein FRC02_009653 [Tulasnella sp. 418]KAG8959601.1 hypothetical protein FRC03_007724 [Tulasnella sp. 419]